MEHFSKSTTLFFQNEYLHNAAPTKEKGRLGGISCGVSNFYGTVIEIWAGFGPVGITDKKKLANFE